MFILKKIFEAFILPPGCGVVLLGGLSLYLWRRDRKAAVVCAALSCMVWVGTCKFISDVIIRPLENTYRVPAKPQGDVIVMLCAGFRGGGTPFSASERLAPGTLERAAAAFKLYKDTHLPVLISGGAPFSPRPESEAAAAYLEELGVPAGALITEEASRDTYENAAFSMKLCREKGYKKIILLTSAYHMPRAALLFRRAGAEVVPFPVAFRAGAGRHYFNDYLPGGGLETRLALNEYFALLAYRVRFGHNKS